MKTILKLLLFLPMIVLGQENLSGKRIIESSEEFISGRIVKTLEDSEMQVSTCLRKVGRNDGKYFTFDVYITNKGETKTFRTKNFKAQVETKKKGFVEVDVLTRKEYIEKKEKRQKLRNVLASYAAAVAAENAGTKTSQTDTYSSGYSQTNLSGTVETETDVTAYGSGGVAYGNIQSKSNVNATASTYSSESSSSQTTEYDGAAAYAAAQNEQRKLQEYMAEARKERTKWNEDYLKDNTIYQNETKRGLINVKYKKGSLVRFVVQVENLDYVFDWDPEDAEN